MNLKSSEKILVILGAGHDQLPMYKAARARGIKIIGVDKNNNACSIPFADEFIHISTRDSAGLMKVLGDTRIHGVISPASDVAHETIYELCEHYGLHMKPSLQSIKASMDKHFFLEEARTLGIDTPKHYKSNNFYQLSVMAEKIGYPVVVKPVDSSGSKGISCAGDACELEKAFHHAEKNSFKKEVVIEEYIEGTHYSAEMFRKNNRTIIFAISEKKHTGAPGFVTLRHLIPAKLDRDVGGEIQAVLGMLSEHFCIENGPLNFDFIIQGKKIFLIEMNSRLAGNGMPRLIKKSFGADTYELALKLAMGEEEDIPDGPLAIKQYSALQIIHSSVSGRFKRISVSDSLKKHPAFDGIEIFAKEGDNVEIFGQANNKLGYVVSAHQELRMVEEMLAIAEKSIRVEIL